MDKKTTQLGAFLMFSIAISLGLSHYYANYGYDITMELGPEKDYKIKKGSTIKHEDNVTLIYDPDGEPIKSIDHENLEMVYPPGGPALPTRVISVPSGSFVTSVSENITKITTSF